MPWHQFTVLKRTAKRISYPGASCSKSAVHICQFDSNLFFVDFNLSEKNKTIANNKLSLSSVLVGYSVLQSERDVSSV